MMNGESRKIRRFAVQLPCAFGDGDDRKGGTILNLSPQGCAMMTPQILMVSTYTSLTIDLSDGTAPVDIELAAVRWVSEQRCGLEFIRVSPEMLARLRAFTLSLENASF
jgi:hypothetical protein